jgi:hypothetical protein
MGEATAVLKGLEIALQHSLVNLIRQIAYQLCRFSRRIALTGLSFA